MQANKKIAILGTGNIGSALAKGLGKSGQFNKADIYLTRRTIEKLEPFKKEGFRITADNGMAVKNSDTIILCVEPHQAEGVMQEIASILEPKRHILISVVSGLSIAQIQKQINKPINIIRAMPNTAIQIGESMTCLAGLQSDDKSLQTAESIFSAVGETLIIKEEQMAGATSLGACGIAFFLRAIRAASQGGIEIGFHAEDALKIAAHTARGAASLLTSFSSHPESEIDRVTTPRGCTISGLNQMEHAGFSSAMIKGIKISADKADQLYKDENNR